MSQLRSTEYSSETQALRARAREIYLYVGRAATWLQADRVVSLTTNLSPVPLAAAVDFRGAFRRCSFRAYTAYRDIGTLEPIQFNRTWMVPDHSGVFRW